MGKVVSFINMKGGVGKTTLSVNIANTLARHFGKRVLLIDVDSQMNSSQYCLKSNQIEEILQNKEKTLFSLFYRERDLDLPRATCQNVKKNDINNIFNVDANFDVIPCHLHTMTLPINDYPYRLKEHIKENLITKYDVIILDSPPSISAFTRIALLASDCFIIPMKTDYLSFLGLEMLERTVKEWKEFPINFELAGIILTLVNPHWKIYKSIKEKIKLNPNWRSKLFSSELLYRIDIAKALENIEENKSPFMYDLDSENKAQIIAITQEFLQKVRL